MYNLLRYILVAIFIVLSVLHFYWALGGAWGFTYAIPTTAEGLPVLSPGLLDCVIVGTGLLAFSLFYAIVLKDLRSWRHPRIVKGTGYLIAAIFLLRAIGDISYVGFFKEVTGTLFARMDTLYYSPLCLFISLAGFYLISVGRRGKARVAG